MQREIKMTDLTNDEIYTCDEVLLERDRLNFVWELWFDVDKYFGTETRDYDDRWVNFYTDWDPSDDSVIGYLVVDRDDRTDESYWDLTKEEQDFLRNKMTERAKFDGYGSLMEMYEDYYK